MILTKLHVSVEHEVLMHYKVEELLGKLRSQVSTSFPVGNTSIPMGSTTLFMGYNNFPVSNTTFPVDDTRGNTSFPDDEASFSEVTPVLH